MRLSEKTIRQNGKGGRIYLPQPAFRRGVHAVAATKITDLAGARTTILEGGGTPQFIQYGQKYTLIPG
jgi:uncharacterized protein